MKDGLTSLYVTALFHDVYQALLKMPPSAERIEAQKNLETLKQELLPHVAMKQPEVEITVYESFLRGLLELVKTGAMLCENTELMYMGSVEFSKYPLMSGPFVRNIKALKEQYVAATEALEKLLPVKTTKD